VSTLIAFSTAYFVVPLWACLAWTGVSVAVAGYGSHVIWSLPPHVQRDRRAVVALVSAVVFCYTAPIALQAALDLASGRVDTVVVLCAAGVAASLTSGGAVFAAGIPEKWFPNVFDYVGSSHQLMHLGALAAHAFEYLFLWEMLERRMAGPGGEVRAGSSLVASAAAGLWAAAGAGAGAAVAWRPAEGQQSASWPSLLAALVGGDGKEL
jgi:predicted membrane channel-forming protein YqfA (hemolysin III family)